MKSNFTFSLPALVLAALGGCMTPLQDLDLSLKRPSAQGRFVVSMQPPASAPAINQIHSWQVRVASPTDTPVSQARITVDGGMPQHGHGLPTRPQFTQELADGTYLIEGMKFSMAGWWEMNLAIQTPEGTDNVTFNTLVTDPAAKR